MTQINPYPMPFLMAPEKFAAAPPRRSRGRSSYAVIPWQMGIVAKLLRMLPNWSTIWPSATRRTNPAKQHHE
jgi:hypothetical protein